METLKVMHQNGNGVALAQMQMLKLVAELCSIPARDEQLGSNCEETSGNLNRGIVYKMTTL